MIASIMVAFGFPMTTGGRLLANTKGADIAPDPARTLASLRNNVGDRPGQVVPPVG